MVLPELIGETRTVVELVVIVGMLSVILEIVVNTSIETGDITGLEII